MNTRPRLHRSIPFWVLIVGSLASAGAGAFLLVDKLATMETALASGTATGIEVYVGQIWAVLGAVLVGAGVVGLALALTLGALRSFAAVPAKPTDTVDIAETADANAAAESAAVTRAPEHGYERNLGYTGAVDTVDTDPAAR